MACVGSSLCRISRRRRANQNGGLLSDKDNAREHDIYAGYCLDDKNSVRPIIDTLKQKLEVYDPHEDAMPNETVFKAWLDSGINRSNISLIFLTKNFVRQSICKFQADHAVLRYTKTRGAHRVVVVMLQSCKVPKNLHHFNCVYAWKFREEPLEQYKRIFKAISAPKVKFRRGSILWHGLGTNTARLAKQTVGDVQMQRGDGAEMARSLSYKLLLFNLGRLKFALVNCELKCTSENCAFRCSGDHILDVFYTHVKQCKYQRVKCRFCQQTIMRKNHQRHEQTTCRRRHVRCPNESCAQKLAVSEMRKHARVCSYKEESCPNDIYGCSVVFARKDKRKHLEICAYEKEVCSRCGDPYFQVDKYTHRCRATQFDQASFHSVPLEQYRYQCYYDKCLFIGSKNDLEVHQKTCEFRVEQCPDCGMRFPVRDLIWHQKQCDQIIECDLCHQFIPMSSKLTHDRWMCTGQNIRELCEICQTCVSSGRKENHMTSCYVGTHNGFRDVCSSSDVSAMGQFKTNQHISTNIQYGQNSSGGGTSLASIRKPREDQSLTCFTNEKIILDIVQTQVPSNERQYQDDTDDSHESFSSSHRSIVWTPSKRKIWRALMDGIDKNQSDLKKVTKIFDR